MNSAFLLKGTKRFKFTDVVKLVESKVENRVHSGKTPATTVYFIDSVVHTSLSGNTAFEDLMFNEICEIQAAISAIF